MRWCEFEGRRRHDKPLRRDVVPVRSRHWHQDIWLWLWLWLRLWLWLLLLLHGHGAIRTLWASIGRRLGRFTPYRHLVDVVQVLGTHVLSDARVFCGSGAPNQTDMCHDSALPLRQKLNDKLGPPVPNTTKP